MVNWTVFALNWAFVGDLNLGERAGYFNKLKDAVLDIPDGLEWPAIDDYTTLIDYEVRLDDGLFSLWKNRVPVLDI